MTAALTHPFPASYAGLTYNSLHVFGFESTTGRASGATTSSPEHGDEVLSEEEAATHAPDYLREELADRLARGPVNFHVRVELADADDPIDDSTAIWPEGRQQVELGQLRVTGLAFDREQAGDVLVFDPTRVTDGIRCPDDPILLAVRTRTVCPSAAASRRPDPSGHDSRKRTSRSATHAGPPHGARRTRRDHPGQPRRRGVGSRRTTAASGSART